MPLASSAHAYLAARRTEVDLALDALLPRPPACPALLAEAMRYSIKAGGKRLRPLLCLASAEAVGGNHMLAMPVACAVELIHTYSLIHDDLPAMDDDSLRRGQPTLHVVAGEGQAILAGDGLLTYAFEVVTHRPVTGPPNLDARKLRAVATLARAAGPEGMVGGQALDLACVRPDPDGHLLPALDAEGLRAMHARKTGALIRGAAAAGAIMGGGNDTAIAAIEAAACELGLAFQIVDDILDVEGATADLGKTTGKDAAEGKPTYPSIYGVETSRRMAEECLDRAEGLVADAGFDAQHVLEIGSWIVHRSQ